MQQPTLYVSLGLTTTFYTPVQSGEAVRGHPLLFIIPTRQCSRFQTEQRKLVRKRADLRCFVRNLEGDERNERDAEVPLQLFGMPAAFSQ